MQNLKLQFDKLLLIAKQFSRFDAPVFYFNSIINMHKLSTCFVSRNFLRLSLLALFLAAVPLLAFASFTGNTEALITETAKDSTEPKNAKDFSYHKSWAIGIQAGLPGLGAEVAYNLNQHFNARLRSTYFIINDYQIKYEVSDQPVSVGLQADLLAFDLLAEYLPWKGSSFKLVAGAAYFNSFGASTTIMLDENTQFGEIELEPDQVGSITISNQSAGLAPYAGLGFGRAVPKRRVGFSFEMGTYYLPAPDIELAASGLMSPNANAEQERKFEEAFSSFRWLPHMMFKIAVRLD